MTDMEKMNHAARVGILHLWPTTDGGGNMDERVKLAYEAGVLSKEAIAFFWSLEFCHKNKKMPSIRNVCEGVEHDCGESLTRAAAGRGLLKAKRRIVLGAVSGLLSCQGH